MTAATVMFAGAVRAQVPRYGANVTFDQARKAMTVAQAEARKTGWPVAGGIGVSGVSSDQDGVVAKAGADAAAARQPDRHGGAGLLGYRLVACFWRSSGAA